MSVRRMACGCVCVYVCVCVSVLLIARYELHWEGTYRARILIYLLMNLLAYVFTHSLTYELTPVLIYLLTPWSRVLLLQKLTGSQPVKKFPTFYGTRRFITAFTTALRLSLS